MPPEQDNRHRKAATTVTWAGLGVNVFLAVFKFICGYLGRSQAVVADAVHTLSDCVTDLTILIGIPFWTAPADRSHPHGHRRIETLVTAVLAASLAFVAVMLAFNALTTLKDRHDSPRWIAFIAAVVSVVVKEGIYRMTVKVGKRIKSSAVIANAWHHRSDALSSIPVALAVAGSKISANWAFLDQVGAVIASLFILRAAWQIGWPALSQLVDTAASEEVQRQIRDIVLATDGVERVHAIRTRYTGSALEVDLHIWVDGDLSVRDGHHISEVVKQRLLDEGPGVVDVIVHLEPCREDQQGKGVK